ncbi:hypothetical protein [Moorena sp. SIO4A5]|uniref:hypothetical protein n=1 Tax=Moorena sp. SIO4A5 TaxID=2607838 RepID=UPI0013CD0F58|nr:hypothetical protein [Moorena sp. SIO4A5]NEO23048.1 hypothetical protein [Moorena sp. SIO4A5]
MAKSSKEPNGRLENLIGSASPNWVPESNDGVPTANDVGDIVKGVAVGAAVGTAAVIVATAIDNMTNNESTNDQSTNE